MAEAAPPAGKAGTPDTPAKPSPTLVYEIEKGEASEVPVKF